MRTRTTRVVTLCSSLLALGMFAACGDDDGEGAAGAGTMDGGVVLSDAAMADGATPEARRYAYVSQVFGANDQTSYLRLHEGDPFQGLATTGGVERAGRALVVAGPDPASVFYVTDKSATVDKYVAVAGAFQPGPTVNFAAEGVMGLSEYAGQLVMVSATKAIYFDARTLKAIVWNPSTSTITRAIDLSQLATPNFSATFSTLAVIKGEKVYMPVGYRTPVAVPSLTAMVVVDARNDTATIVKDERCGYVRDAVDAGDGQLYLATEAFASAVHYLNSAAAPSPCLLRFDLTNDRYDPDFKVDLNQLAGGRTVGSLVKLPNGKVYTRLLDPAKIPDMPVPSGRAIASAEAWTWSEVALGATPTLTDVADGFVAGGSIIPMDLGGLFVYPAFSADLSKTTLCDMSSGPVCTRRVEVPGLVFSMALLR